MIRKRSRHRSIHRFVSAVNNLPWLEYGLTVQMLRMVIDALRWRYLRVNNSWAKSRCLLNLDRDRMMIYYSLWGLKLGH